MAPEGGGQCQGGNADQGCQNGAWEYVRIDVPEDAYCSKPPAAPVPLAVHTLSYASPYLMALTSSPIPQMNIAALIAQ